MVSKLRRCGLTAAIAIAALATVPTASLADDGELLAPQTRVRLTVVQWAPSKGQYERWDSLGGEFVVSSSGKISTPIVGAISVSGLDSAGLAKAIAEKLQAKIGLVSVPDATVEIVEYPPIYVVGDVATPGERRFRTGLTVLQAFAMSGGETREASRERSQEEIKLAGELRWIDDAILRGGATIARLQAEMDGAKEVRFDDVQADEGDRRRTAEIFNQEKIIFAARGNELNRQSQSFAELRELFKAEIGVLGQRVKDADSSIASASSQLDGVKTLVERGFATTSRQSGLERDLASYRTERLEQITATMRANQAVSEATRNLEGLHDQRRTEIAASMQKEQANIDALRLKRETNQQLLLETVSNGSGAGPKDAKATIAFSIVRREGDTGREFPASESTPLEPGDVLKVRLDRSGGGEPKLSDLDAASAPERVVR